MAICLSHNSQIVDEDYSMDWAIREEAQIPFLTFILVREEEPSSCKRSMQLRVVSIRSSRAQRQHVWQRKKITN